MDSEHDTDEEGTEVPFEAFPSNVIESPDKLHKKKTKKKSKSGGFESLGLSTSVFRAIKRKGYQVPTPIQRKTLPLVLAGYDVVAMARTGSGKTAAFIIPMLEKLKVHSSKVGVRAIILSPTRELALQTFRFCKELGRFTDLRCSVLVGGDSMESQFEELASNPDVIIATPGRLMHHLSEVEGMSLRTVEYAVFDEADRLFEMGFAEQLRQILSHLSESRQTLLFSATLPRLLANFAKAGLRDPHVVRLDLDTKISPDLKLLFFTVPHEEKPAALVYLVREHIQSDQQTIIFVSTKHHVEFLHELLRKEGLDLSVVYGAMDQAARKIHLAKFRARKTMLLLVTDVAARGIDIPLLDNVINYDFPSKPKLFIHRVGRAARAGRVGTAFSFVTPDEISYLLDLHLFLSRPIHPSPTEEELAANPKEALSKVNEAIENGDIVYGKLSQSILDRISEKLRGLVEQNFELAALKKSCNSAHHLYVKTRPSPSGESTRRAKLLPKAGLHPLFKGQVGSMEAAALSFTESLKKFRPKQTILEIEGEAMRSVHMQTQVGQVEQVMKRKRAMHEPVINSTHHQFQQKLQDDKEHSNGKLRSKDAGETSVDVPKSKRRNTVQTFPKSYRDDDYYINSMPANKYGEEGLMVDNAEKLNINKIDMEILDLLPDDQETIQKQKAVYHWDKKHKKFVKLHHGEKVSASGKVKTESGAKVNVNNRGIYKKWRDRTNLHVSSHGDEESLGLSGGKGPHDGDKMMGRCKHRNEGRIPNANARDEIRSIEEVHKQRRQKILKGLKMGKGRSKARGKFYKKPQKGRKGKHRK